MSKKMTLDDLRNLIVQKCCQNGESEIAPETSLFDHGILDSFSVMQLVTELEERLSITFDYKDLRREYFSTAEALHLLLVKKYGVPKDS